MWELKEKIEKQSAFQENNTLQSLGRSRECAGPLDELIILKNRYWRKLAVLWLAQVAPKSWLYSCQVGTGNGISKTYLEPCFNNWYNCTSSIEQLRKISDLLFWPVFSPSPTSYFLNNFFLYFSPPSPSLKLFQKHRNCARLTQIFLYKGSKPKPSIPGGTELLNELGCRSCARSCRRREL